MQLRGFCPDEKLPRGILLKGREAIKTGKPKLRISTGCVLQSQRSG